MLKTRGNVNTAELDKLFDEVSTYRSSKDYSEILNFMRRFRKIAPFNLMLVQIQKPGSQYIATAEDWKQRFGRNPRPGARPLVILHPFGPVKFVYKLSDTEGRDFPQEMLNPFKAEGHISELELERFIKNIYLNGFGTYSENYGTERAGQIQVVNSFGTHNSECFMLPFAITINKNHDATTRLTTIYHELGHAYCGHLYNPAINYLPQRYGLPLQVREFEAESVCWMLCERHGIKNPSAEYLSGYLNQNEEIPNISINTVLKAVTAIEQLKNYNSDVPRKILRLSDSDKRRKKFHGSI